MKVSREVDMKNLHLVPPGSILWIWAATIVLHYIHRVATSSASLISVAQRARASPLLVDKRSLRERRPTTGKTASAHPSRPHPHSCLAPAWLAPAFSPRPLAGKGRTKC